MRLLRDISIRRKQVLIIMLTSTVALLVACASFIWHDASNFRREMVERLESIAGILGNNLTAAIDFDDPAAANETLAALRGEPDIVHAHVHKSDGTAFATYEPAALPMPSDWQHQSNGEVVFNDHLFVFRPITRSGETLGTIEIAISLRGLRERLWRYAGIAGAVLAAALVLVYLISARLERLISGPILELARMARTVAHEKNYALRATRRTNDEIGQLIDNFNAMLGQIELRDGQLEAARATLEHRVEERTAELRSAQEETARERVRLQFIFEHAPVGISLRHVQADGREGTFLINDAHLRICGLARAQAAEPGIFQRITHPEDLLRQADVVREFIAGRADCFTMEKRYLTPDGRTVWVAFSVQRRDFADGSREDLTTLVDITALKQAQEEIARERARFKFIFESVPVGISWFVPNEENTHIVNPAHEQITGVSAEQARLPGAFERVSHPDDLAHQKELTTQFVSGAIDRFSLEKRYLHADGRVVWAALSSRMFTNPATGARQSVTSLVDITNLKQSESELASSLAVLNATLESTVDGVLVADLAGRFTTYNRKFVEMWRLSPGLLADGGAARIREMIADQVADTTAFIARVQEIYAEPDAESFDELALTDGRIFERYSQPQRIDGVSVGRVWCFRDITARRKAEAELQDAHRQLLEISRQAGMAEVATGVLHNVGNVLNSVNVSSTIVAERLRDSEVGNLAKVCALLRQHEHDLGAFLTSDPRGRKIPAFLDTLAEHLASEHATVLTEVEQLRHSVEHIKEIVAMQQSYAKVSGIAEAVSVVEMVEDAIRMNAGALVRHDVRLVRDFQARPTLTLEKHKVLQILVNLIRNAKYACDDAGRPDKLLTVRITADERCVQIAIIDNGVGIPAENLTRIFSHGFTTRKNGHGFGLHSGALAAKELGGSLTARSDGPGQGAAFVLEIPCRREECAA